MTVINLGAPAVVAANVSYVNQNWATGTYQPLTQDGYGNLQCGVKGTQQDNTPNSSYKLPTLPAIVGSNNTFGTVVSEGWTGGYMAPLLVDTEGHLQVDVADGTVAITYADDAQLDAFQRLRVAEPQTLFDSKQLVDNQPLFWDDQTATGVATSTYNINQSSSTLAVTGNVIGSRVRQTFQRFGYQPGKALSNDEMVLTYQGWKRMGDMQEGDIVFDANGKSTRVKYVAPQGERPLYRFTFDDGTTVDADEEHLWVTINKKDKRHKFYGGRETLTTKQMFDKYPTKWNTERFCIPASPVLNLLEKKIPLSGYTVGALLGDGSMMGSTPQFTTADPEMLKWIDGIIKTGVGKYHYSICGISDVITQLDMHHRAEYKFVPKDYLWNHASIRLAVLQGLMDTDGTVDANDGTAEFNTASPQLAKDVEFLVRSLGGQTKIRQREAGYTKEGEYHQCLDSYRIRVIIPVCPFRLARKANKWKPRTRISFDRYVHSIEAIGSGLATCIAVESEDGTFLTAGHVVTHNSNFIAMTGIFGSQATGITKRLGYFDQKNGLFFQQNPTGMAVGIRTNTSGTPSDTIIQQASWNTDTLNGTNNSTNPSGITLDPTKPQIFVIDFQWLGVGRIRFGFVIEGDTQHCEIVNNANITPLVYMSLPNLPLRYEIDSDGTGSSAAASLVHICSTVISEGGRTENGPVFSADLGISGFTSLSTSNIYPILALRLKSSYQMASIDVLNYSTLCTSSSTYRYCLLLNPTVTGTALSFSDITNSALQVATPSNATTVSGGTQIDSGYAVANSTTPPTVTSSVPSDLRLGANIAGVSDILVLAIQIITGTTETFLGNISWRESI